MKKLLIIPFMLVYMAAMSGVVVHLHYCCDRLVDVSLGAGGDGCGDCDKSAGGGCKTKKRKKCCADKEISYKGAHEHKAASVPLSIAATYAALLPAPVFNGLRTVFAASPIVEVIPFAANAPPGPWQNIPLYKLHSQRVYYA